MFIIPYLSVFSKFMHIERIKSISDIIITSPFDKLVPLYKPNE